NEGLELKFNVELLSFFDAISDEELQKENVDSEICYYIITLISEDDDYSWVYHIKNQKKTYFLHVVIIFEIKTFIKDNIEISVPEIWHQIQESCINGYENLTVQQTYYWWSIESRKRYCRDSDPLLLAKHLLEEFNQEIVVDNLNSSMPVLEESIIKYEVSSDKKENKYETELEYLHEILNKTKILLEESYNKPKGHLWLKNIHSNFKSLEKMNNDIVALNNHLTMPKTWKDFIKNTMYWV
ncbi:25524_t:CDS:2, partial [Racocetra persica]